MMTRGFPNLFVMPAPAQQVVTVNYAQLAVLAAEFIGAAVRGLDMGGLGLERRRIGRLPQRTSRRHYKPAKAPMLCG
jgi:hypothetical protein